MSRRSALTLMVVGMMTPALAAPQQTPMTKVAVKKAPAKAAPKTSAPQVAARPAGAKPAQAVKPTRVAVLRFKGPEIFDLDADEFWKVKNHQGEPTEGDLATIPDVLQKTIADKLAGRLGGLVISNDDLKRFQLKTGLSANQSEQLSGLAKNLGVRYAVTGTIDRLEFDGNTATPDDYILILSTRVIDTTTGQTVWSEELRKFKSEVYTKKHGNVLGVFSNRHIPEAADVLSSEIAGALGR